jgi:transposase
MKKKAYRAREIKDVDRKRLAQLVEGRDVVVGVDVAKENQFAALTVGNKEVVETLKWRHPDKTSEFIDLLSSLPCSSLEVALEPTGSYGDALRYRMLAAGLAVFRVSPKKAHDAKEIYDGVPSSHDAKSAAIVAWLHWEQASEAWPMAPEGIRELKAATSLLTLHDEHHQQGLNRLEALLARHWPEVTDIIALDSVTLLTVLTKYGGPKGVVRAEVQADRLMVQASRGSLSKEKISKVLNSARSTVGVPQFEEERRILAELAEETLRAQRAKKQANTRVEELAQGMADVKAIGEVVGMLTAAVVVTKVGRPELFFCAHAYEKCSGLNLKIRSSGKYEGHLKITKRGSGQARKYLYLAVLRLIQTDPVIRAWYHRKVERNGGKFKNKAIVALMRKLIRALWHVAREGKPFDSRLLFDTTRLGLAMT